jgi:nickel/cobalt transporter (NicO) family protein
MNIGPELLLIGAVAGVGVLHTIVPDHWVPITLIARQRGWTKAETARASFQAGIGHVLSTLLIASVVWLAGVAVAAHFGQIVDTAASMALIAFGGWIAISAWREMAAGKGHGHSHDHADGHSHAHHFTYLDSGGIHGPELRRLPTDHGDLILSIYEASVPPRFRLTGAPADAVKVETLRADGARQIFLFANHGTYWESVDQIPEPHGFEVAITIEHGGHLHTYETEFTEHDHGHSYDHSHGDDHGHERDPADDPLYAPLRGDVAVLTRHAHVHRHGRGAAHLHWHDHAPETAHSVTERTEWEPPLHEHRHKTSARTALLLILGSSPMVEGIPAFFAASKFGITLIIAMAIIFATSTIATYVILCVYSTAGLQRVQLGAFERYGEVLSGGFIALVGIAFWIWPVL